MDQRDKVIQVQEEICKNIISQSELEEAIKTMDDHRNYVPYSKPPLYKPNTAEVIAARQIIRRHKIQQILKIQGAGELPILDLFSVRIINNIKSYDLLGDKNIMDIKLSDLAKANFRVFPLRSRNFGNASVKEIEYVLQYHGLLETVQTPISKFEYENALRIVEEYERIY